jgi:hypothetical protein
MLDAAVFHHHDHHQFPPLLLLLRRGEGCRAIFWPEGKEEEMGCHYDKALPRQVFLRLHLPS